jgi:hypothetical protein
MRWFLDQQSCELSVGQSQLQYAREQQLWFSAVVVFVCPCFPQYSSKSRIGQWELFERVPKSPDLLQ